MRTRPHVTKMNNTWIYTCAPCKVSVTGITWVETYVAAVRHYMKRHRS